MENTSILREWFDRVDSDRSGNITALQLKRALSVGNLEFSLSVVQQMIRMYDFDRNGTMNFEEFVALNKFLLKVQHAFSDLERGRGFLVPEDVHEALVKVGFMLDSPAFYTVCEWSDREITIVLCLSFELISQFCMLNFASERTLIGEVFVQYPNTKLTVSLEFFRALIKVRMEGFGLMTSYLSVYSHSLLGTFLTHLIQRNKAESHLILTNLSIALAIVECDSNI